MEYVKVHEASGVKRATIQIDVAAHTVIRVADNRSLFAVVTGVQISDGGEPLAAHIEMRIQPVGLAHSAAFFLIVPAPVVPLRIQPRAVRAGVKPVPIRLLNRRQPVVEAPCLQKTMRVRRHTSGVYMKCARLVERGSQARLVIRADEVVASAVHRATIDKVARAVAGDLRPTPQGYLSFCGLRMLHVWHRRCSR